MHPYYALKSIGRTQPTSVLDIGTRDFSMARAFASHGFQVHAIDPKPVALPKAPTTFTFEQTTLEAFEAPQSYGLVIASYVSHLVKYETSAFLRRLASLSKPDGLIYVTLLGDRDGWVDRPWAMAANLTTTRKSIETAKLGVLYQSTEQFDGHLYDGTPKHWHLFKFVLGKPG